MPRNPRRGLVYRLIPALVPALASCASPLKLVPIEGFELASPSPIAVTTLANENFQGSPTALATTSEGTILLATVSDVGDTTLRAISDQGQEYWKIDPGAAVAELAPLAGGVVVSAALDGVRGFGSTGEFLWKIDTRCHVRALKGGEAWLCFDEKAARGTPSVLMFDARGQILNSYGNRRDLLSWDVSPDGAFIALGFRDGAVVLLGPDLKPLATFILKGEPVALAVAERRETGRSATAVLLRTREGQRLAFVGGGLERRKPVKLPSHVGGIARIPGAALAALYGNSPAGQFFAYCDADSSLSGASSCALRLERRLPGFPEHASPLIADDRGAVLGLETRGQKALSRVDLEGRISWAIPLKGEGFLLARKGAGILAVATDRGTLSVLAEHENKTPESIGPPESEISIDSEDN